MSRAVRHDVHRIRRMEQADVVYRCRCGWEGETFFAATSHIFAALAREADETATTTPTPGDAA